MPPPVNEHAQVGAGLPLAGMLAPRVASGAEGGAGLRGEQGRHHGHHAAAGEDPAGAGPAGGRGLHRPGVAHGQGQGRGKCVGLGQRQQQQQQQGRQQKVTSQGTEREAGDGCVWVLQVAVVERYAAVLSKRAEDGRAAGDGSAAGVDEEAAQLQVGGREGGSCSSTEGRW